MNEIKLLFTTLFKISNIIYHILQKQFVTDTVNGILNNIYKTLNNNNSGTDCYYVNLKKKLIFQFKILNVYYTFLHRC